jgi:deoxyribodipyrimidine photo-lyase
MTTAIVWFRRDLRLADNPALHAARERHAHVVPIYIHAPEEEQPWSPGAATRWWLHHALAALSASLEKAGAPLLICSGGSLEALRKLVKTVGADAVYWNRLYEPAIVARDKSIKEALREDGLEVESFNASLLAEPWELKTGGGGPYRVFSPFYRSLDARLRAQLEAGRVPIAEIGRLKASPLAPDSEPLASLALLPKIAWDSGFRSSWTPGESGASARLEAFCQGAAARYREARDLPAVDATSGLSPHLHFGEISPLQIALRIERLLSEGQSAGQAAGVRANAEWFVREVGWREFAHHLLFHYPQTTAQPLNAQFAAFPWRSGADYAADLRAWQRGNTGIPIVDAGMRQLWHTGWMHNRVRMIVASFLTKNLLIPWQEGAAWFWDTLVDADLANNTLGWQWSAGSGADAAPYFRIFNPVLQSAKFDERAAYLRQWVPELARLDDASIHAPWEAKPAALQKAGFVVGRDYPAPIVDLRQSRDRALQAYEAIKRAD